jgi:hypothetical protein
MAHELSSAVIPIRTKLSKWKQHYRVGQWNDLLFKLLISTIRTFVNTVTSEEFTYSLNWLISYFMVCGYTVLNDEEITACNS